MANTPSFNWETPDDTDLVKDGAAAIRTLGNAIDSSMTDLKGGTTGQVLSKASNTDMDFTWTSETDPTAISKTLLDAKADLITATAADTPARLAVGTDGQVLTADSTQSTGLKWATPASALTWTVRYQPTGQSMNRIAYNGSNLYVAVGNEGTLLTSSDGLTWTSRTSGFGVNNILSVTWFANASLWVIVGDSGLLSTSPDGITWTARTANMSTNTIQGVLAVGSDIVAIGSGGGTTNTGGITYSTNGTTWTRKSQSLTVGATYESVAHNGTNWIVVANSVTNNYLYASTPSGTWTVGARTTASLRQVFYDGTRTFIVRNDGEMHYTTSATFASWTTLSNNLAAAGLGSAQAKYIHYYNGRVYWFTTASSTIPYLLYDASTSISTNSVNQLASENTPSFSPMAYTQPGTVWVGAAGRILAIAGGIYTSF